MQNIFMLAGFRDGKKRDVHLKNGGRNMDLKLSTIH
jgi:hypothetical protein